MTKCKAEKAKKREILANGIEGQTKHVIVDEKCQIRMAIGLKSKDFCSSGKQRNVDHRGQKNSGYAPPLKSSKLF